LKAFFFDASDPGFTEFANIVARPYGVDCPIVISNLSGDVDDEGTGDWSVHQTPAPPSLILALLGALLAGYRLRHLSRGA
jgi:hypothetical protein